MEEETLEKGRDAAAGKAGREGRLGAGPGGGGGKEGHCKRQAGTTHSTPGKEAGTWNTDVAMRRRGRGGRREDEREEGGGSLRGG